jgi:hypothetical protein
VKSRIRVRLAAGLTAGAMMLSLTGPALAQTQGNQVGQATFGNLIAALNNINLEINNLEALNDLTITEVRVVNVENVLNGNSVNALNNSLNRNEVDIAVLQDFLNNSLNDNVVIIREVLSNNNVAIDDVVAIDVLSGGEVVIFVQR